MDPTLHVEQAAQLKALSDPNRIEILRLVMAAPSTLSQLGAQLERHPAWIRHHVKQLEAAGFVELVESRKVAGYTEKYYAATATAFVVDLMITPRPVTRDVIVVLGSDDPALELLAVSLHEAEGPDVFRLPMGSLEGLIALRQGRGHVVGCHLLDSASGDYNDPYLRHLFPGRSFSVITLAHRQQGLAVAPGNPLGLRSLRDVVEAEARFANRNAGSGTRVWLDRRLDGDGLARKRLSGYSDELFTHREVAAAVAEGRADAGLAVRAAAEAEGLGFVPLFEERFDLVIPAEIRHTALLEPFVRTLSSAEFKTAVEALGGYSTRHSGDERAVAA